MSKYKNEKQARPNRAKQKVDGPLISSFGKPGALFSQEAKNEILHPQIIKMARKSGQLNLSNKGMTAIPQKVFHIHELDEDESKQMSLNMKMDSEEDKWWEQVDLVRLNLNSNCLTSIDPLISSLEALQILDVSDNRLTSLPSTLGDLKCLHQLTLSHNDLHELPEAICKICDLRTLAVDHNNLTTLPNDIGLLCVLEQLNASHNAIETIPSSVGYLQRLKKCNLSDNKLRELPIEIGDLFGLVHFDLNRNRLEELPASLSNLPKLEDLSVRQNLLSTLPSLKSPPLTELYVGENKIKMLDTQSLESLAGLRVLDVSGNGIEELPDEITLLQMLQRLDLTGNYISNLPTHLGLLPHLKALPLEGNPLRLIRRDIIQRGTPQLLKYLASKVTAPVQSYPGFENYVPEEIPDREKPIPDQYEMRNTRVMVYNEKAKEIPDALFENGLLAHVRTADLSCNQLSSLSEKITELADHVYELILNHNRLTDLSPCVGRLKHLQFIDVQNNQLSSLPQELAQLRLLREINLSFNRFCSIPSVLYEVSTLEILFAGDNKITSIDAEQLLKLNRLTVLDLHNNDIDFVPPLLGKMTQLRTLLLEGNAFRVPRFDLLSKGCSYVLEYLRSRIVE